jgi:ABC-type polar amino acid transport system ATPase subunit
LKADVVMDNPVVLVDEDTTALDPEHGLNTSILILAAWQR